jgi:hypothetical protein
MYIPPPPSSDAQARYDNMMRQAEATRQARLDAIRRERGHEWPGSEDEDPPYSSRGSGPPAEREALESPWILEDEVPREPVRAAEVVRPQAQPAQPARPSAPLQRAVPKRRALLVGLASRRGLRTAIVMREILGPPKGLVSPDQEASGPFSP